MKKSLDAVEVAAQILAHQKGTNLLISRPILEELVQRCRGACSDALDDLQIFPFADTVKLTPVMKVPKADVTVRVREKITDDKAMTGMFQQAEEEQASLDPRMIKSTPDILEEVQ